MTISNEAVEKATDALGRQTRPGTWSAKESIRAALEAAAPIIRAEALEELLTPESLERARKVVEDELVDWRENGLFTLRRNGLAIRNKDGSGSEIIRFGFEVGLRIAVKDHVARAVVERGKS